jgi:predicted RNA polymerase sigma factor
MTASETHQAIEASFRIERARLIAGLARMVRDVDRAEARSQFEAAAALTRNLAERAFLCGRAEACDGER